jgi:hypothetical protein
MHTECPSCKKQHPITVKKLRLSEGRFTCNRCYISFDPVEYLSERSFFGLYQKGEPVISDKERERLSFANYWKYGIALSLFVFALQIYFFKGDALVQNKTLRPWLSSITSVFGSSLAPYKNSEEFSVLNVSFDPVDQNTFLLKAVLINQADFPQNQPTIKLILKDFVGDVFAERLFQPQEYAKNKQAQIEPEMSAEIKLIIAAPSKKIGGYHFEII